MTSIPRCLWAFAAALLLATPVLGAPLGQEYRGRVQGSLTDEARLALPGAHVTLRNDATGVAVTRTTGAEGRYLVDYVDPGTYTLTAELSGFTTVVQRNVLVQARGDVTVDVMLKVAGLAETVARALADPRAACALRERARADVVARYDLQTVCLPLHLALARRVSGP